MDPQRLSGYAAVWVVLVVFEAVHGVLVENTLLSEAISSDGVKRELGTNVAHCRVKGYVMLRNFVEFFHLLFRANKHQIAVRSWYCVRNIGCLGSFSRLTEAVWYEMLPTFL